MVQVERELHEAANLPAVAESLKESARDELRGAEAIRNELAFLGQEALNLLGVESGQGERPQQGLPLSETQRSSLVHEESVHDERQAAFAPGTDGTAMLEGQAQAYPARELLTNREEVVEATTSASWESAETQTGRPGIVDEDSVPRPEPVPDTMIHPADSIPTEFPQQAAPRAEPNQPVETSSESTAAEELRREIEAIGLSGPISQDVAAHAAEPSEVSPSGAAQELIRELEALRNPAEPLQSRPSSAAEYLTNELAALNRLGATAAPPPDDPPPAIVLDAISSGPGQDEETSRSPDLTGQAGPEESPVLNSAASPSQSYTGRLYLMFSASLSQDSLESVWDFLEDVGGPGSIVDMRLVSREAGVQFTMELGAKELGLAELQRRIPKAELVPVDADRIKVNWTG